MQDLRNWFLSADLMEQAALIVAAMLVIGLVMVCLGWWRRLRFAWRWRRPCPVCGTTNFEPSHDGSSTRCVRCLTWVNCLTGVVRRGPQPLTILYDTDTALLAYLHANQDADEEL